METVPGTRTPEGRQAGSTLASPIETAESLWILQAIEPGVNTWQSVGVLKKCSVSKGTEHFSFRFPIKMNPWRGSLLPLGREATSSQTQWCFRQIAFGFLGLLRPKRRTGPAGASSLATKSCQRTALTPSSVENDVSLAVSKKSRMYGASSMSVRTAAYSVANKPFSPSRLAFT